jgi:hypothetical protein
MEKKLWHFTWPVRVLKSGILQIRKRVIILMISEFWHFFGFSKFHFEGPKNDKPSFLFFRAVAVWISVRAPRRKKRQHFSWSVRVLKVEFLKSEKSARILGISGFWNFFRICKISLVSTLAGHVKSRIFFRLKLCGAM